MIVKENELKILKSVGKGVSTEDLARKIGFHKSAVEALCSSLKEKGFVSVKETSRTWAELTEEGKSYAIAGLPERRILEILLRNRSSVSELKDLLDISEDKINIGIGWLKKKGAISLERRGKETLLEITKRGRLLVKKRWVEENFLESLRSPSFVKGGIAKIMQRRELALLKDKKFKKVELTHKGIALLRGKEMYEKAVTTLTPKLIKTGKWKEVKLAKYDVTLPSFPFYGGKRHFLSQVIDYVRRIWLEMGFKEMEGPIVESAFWNYDALYVPQDHPARDLQDTFYLSSPREGSIPKIWKKIKEVHESGGKTGSVGWGYSWDEAEARRCLLRTHTTSLSARTLSKLKEEDLPAKFFSVGQCFRNETPNWKNLAEFYQTDGIVVGNVNFRHLLGYLKRYFSKMGFEKARFRPAYFPYTELSMEIEVFHPYHKKWVELGGAGMFRPEVVVPLLGKDIPVLAWGPGFGRMVMIPYNIYDMRELYENDLGLLRKASLWRL